MLVCAEACGSIDGEAPAGGGERVACRRLVPGDWLSEIVAEFGRPGFR